MKFIIFGKIKTDPAPTFSKRRPSLSKKLMKLIFHEDTAHLKKWIYFFEIPNIQYSV